MAAVKKFRTRFNPHEPHKYATHTVGESKTQQQFKAECDVNNILAKYKRTGMLTHLSKHQGNFGDFANFEDYQTSLEKVMTAQESFGMLPSEIRNRFQNNPGELITYLSDPKNNAEAIRLGLKVSTPELEKSIQEQMEKALENHDIKREKKEKSKTEP